MLSYTKNGAEEIKGKVLFLGDSISQSGEYVSFIHTYFKLHHPKAQISFVNIGISSETVSGLSEPDHPFLRPCVHNRLQRALEHIQPDWVISCYGINDGIYYPLQQEFFEKFQEGYKALVKKVHDKGVKVIVMTPPPFDKVSFTGVLAKDGEESYSYMKTYEEYDEVMATYAAWMMESLVQEADIVVDLYTALKQDMEAMRQKDKAYQSGDGIHPNRHGHYIMADTILRDAFNIHMNSFEQIMEKDEYQLFQMIYERDLLIHHYEAEQIGHDNPYKLDYFPKGQLEELLEKYDEKISTYIETKDYLHEIDSEWCGFKRKNLFFEGYEVSIVMPHRPKEGKPWIWRTEFFGAFAMADLAMVQEGWYLVHINLANQYGCPHGVETMARFQKFISHIYDLNEKVVLFGFSRGGLYALHYAAQYPENVRGLYLDAPVIDIKSWPAGFGEGEGSQKDWYKCKQAFAQIQGGIEVYDLLLEQAFITLVNKRLPMILVAGDKDKIVPFEENGRKIVDVYKGKGIPFKLILKEGVGHHPHSLEQPEDIKKFLIEYCGQWSWC